MAKKYTVEKVLYFANQAKGLHVADSEEARSSDLYWTVKDLVTKAELELVASDDSGSYYKTTRAGDIKLLQLQIA